MLRPHFFIMSNFSTATPLVASSAIADELVLLWCMVDPVDAEHHTGQAALSTRAQKALSSVAQISFSHARTDCASKFYPWPKTATTLKQNEVQWFDGAVGDR